MERKLIIAITIGIIFFVGCAEEKTPYEKNMNESKNNMGSIQKD